MKNISRRNMLKLSGGLTASTLLGGLSGIAQAGDDTSTVTIWNIHTGKQKELVKELVDRFNQTHKNGSAKVQFFSNDPYKTKLRLALGSGNPPDVFFGWGGGILKSYIDAGAVYPLPSDVNTDRFLSSILDPVTFNGELYGIPNSGTQPDLFYYNKKIFDKYDLNPPETWDELLKIVNFLNKKGITPISLAGKNRWPGLMYLMYLVNRIGGVEPFQNVLANKPDAWSDPAFIHANEMIRELISAGAFPQNFETLDYNLGQSTKLLYTNKAAMQLMGAWDYQMIVSNAPDFINQGNLGWFEFPTIKTGEGNPENVVGNPCNFYSISQKSNAKEVAVQYLNDAVLNEFAIEQLIDLGLVPPVKGIRSSIRKAAHAEWLEHIYDMVEQAPHFSLSWDQALKPKAAHNLLLNVDLLFMGTITPKQFSSRMNQMMFKS